MTINPIPADYPRISPILIVHDAKAAIEFYKAAFGAEEKINMPMPDGRVGHAELRVFDFPLMLADEFPDMGYESPQKYGGTPVSLYFYVEDCDAAFARAIEAGGVEMRPVEDMFYGDRTGTFKDPFGHVWTLASKVEEPTEEEINERAEKMFGGGEET